MVYERLIKCGIFASQQKYRIGLILKENGLDKYIKDEVAEPK